MLLLYYSIFISFSVYYQWSKYIGILTNCYLCPIGYNDYFVHFLLVDNFIILYHVPYHSCFKIFGMILFILLRIVSQWSRICHIKYRALYCFKMDIRDLTMFPNPFSLAELKMTCEIHILYKGFWSSAVTCPHRLCNVPWKQIEIFYLWNTHIDSADQVLRRI